MNFSRLLDNGLTFLAASPHWLALSPLQKASRRFFRFLGKFRGSEDTVEENLFLRALECAL